MLYGCILEVPLTVGAGVKFEFTPTVEVSLACYGCQRADRTIILGGSAPAEHWGPALDYDGHPFDGKVLSFDSARVSLSADRDLVTPRYRLAYEFRQFVDVKYPDRRVAPLPTWGRIHFTLTCVCGRAIESFAQTKLSRSRWVCDCGHVLSDECEQDVLFSEDT